MNPGAHIIIAAAARFFIPLTALFALLLLASNDAGGGVGLAAGLAFALVLALHALVFGAAEARAAAPPWLARLVLGAGVAMALVCAGLPALRLSAQLIEAGLFAATTAAAALTIQALFGRAPTLLGEDW